MREISLPFDYLRPQPDSFDRVWDELVEGVEASYAQFSEMFGEQWMRPIGDGGAPGRDADTGDAEQWVAHLSAFSPPHLSDETIKAMPIYGDVAAFWNYVFDARWSKVLALDARRTFHNVKTFCELARFAAEELSFGSISVPINIERLYVRARARMLIDIAREPRCVEESDMLSGALGIEDVALLAGIKPQSVRNAINASGRARLPSRRYQGRILFDPLETHRWLLGRKRYVPTDLTAVALVEPQDGVEA